VSYRTAEMYICLYVWNIHLVYNIHCCVYEFMSAMQHRAAERERLRKEREEKRLQLEAEKLVNESYINVH